MRLEDKVRLAHMRDARLSAQRFIIGKNLTDLASDEMLRFALIRALEIIGEAAARVTDETKQENAGGAAKILRRAYLSGLAGCGMLSIFGSSAVNFYSGVRDGFEIVGVCLLPSLASFGVGWFLGKVARKVTCRSKNFDGVAKLMVHTLG